VVEQSSNDAYEVERLMQEGQFTTAYTLLNNMLNAGAKDDYVLEAQLKSLENDLSTKATQVRRDARAQLDSLLRETDENFDETAAQDVLEQWRLAILDQDTAFSGYEKRFYDKVESYQAYQAYVDVRRDVEYQWNQARQLREDNPNVGIGTLLEIYTKARDLVRSVLSNYPNSSQLKALLDEANQRRDHISNEEENMTSGAQLGQFEITLNHIDKTPDGERVTVYNLNKQSLGARSKEEARAIILEQAATFADEKASEYMFQAETRLDENKPREALEILHQRESLERFMSDDRKLDLNELEVDARKSLELLETSEEKAKDAQNMLANNDALVAWRLYQDALNYYDGAIYSGVVKTSQRAIIQRANADVRKIAQELQSLYKSDDLRQMIDLAEKTIEDYSPLGTEVGAVAEVERWLEDARNLESQKAVAYDTLDNIRQLIRNDQLENAEDKLRKLELEYRGTKILLDPTIKELYDSVKNDVDVRLNAQGQIEHLERDLDSTNIRAIENSIRRAEQAIEQNPAFEKEFFDLAERLKAHKAYVEIKGLESRRQLGAVVEQIDELLGSSTGNMLDNHKRAELEDSREEYQQRLEEQQDAQQILQEAQQLLESDPQRAYEILDDFMPIDPKDERSRDNYLKRAERNWARQIENEISAISIENPPSVATIQGYEDDLAKLDNRLYQRFSAQLSTLIEVREALDAKERGELGVCLAKLQVASENAEPKDSRFINQLVQETRKLMKETEKTQLVNQSRGYLPEEEREDHLARLIDMQQELEKLYNDGSDLDYLIWSFEVLLLQAQLIPDIRRSRDIFSHSKAVADRINSKLTYAPNAKTPQLTRLLELAKNAPQIGNIRTAVDQNLKPKSDIGLFIETQNDWDNIVAPYLEELPLLQQWYDDLVSETRQALRSEIGGGSVSVSNVEPRARLLILNELDDLGKELLTALPRLQATLEKDTEGRVKSISAFDRHGKSSVDILTEQIRQYEKHQTDLENVNRVLERFKASLGDNVQDTLDKNKKSRTWMDAAVNALNLLRQKSVNIDNYISQQKGEVVRDVVDETWAGYISDVNDIQTTLLETIDEISINDIDFEKHPTVKDLESRKEGLFITVEELNDNIEKLKKMVQAEDYSQELRSVTDKVSLKLRAPQFQDVRDSFIVLDPFNNEALTWDKAVNLINKRQLEFKSILAWGASFDIDDMLVGSLKKDAVLAQFRLLDWDAEKAEIEHAITKADFDSAEERLNKLLSTQKIIDGMPADTVPSINSLLEWLNAPPSGITTKHGQNIVNFVQEGNINKYLEAKQECLDLLKTVDRYRDLEKTYIRNFQTGLGQMSANKPSGLLKRMNSKFTQGKATAKKAIDDLRKICPNHPKLQEMNKVFNSYSN